MFTKRYENGRRNTESALKWAYLYGFEYARRKTPQTLVIVTNGESDDIVTNQTSVRFITFETF